MGGIEGKQVSMGLGSYDAVLTSCACFTFFKESDYFRRYLVAVGLSFMAGYVHNIFSNFMNASFTLPALTIAFNIVLLSVISVVASDNSNLVVMKDVSEGEPVSVSIDFIAEATAKGVGQFIFADTVWGGMLIVVGLAVSSRWSAATALCGSFLGCVIALYIIQVPSLILPSIRDGLYGYNAAGVVHVITSPVLYYLPL